MVLTRNGAATHPSTAAHARLQARGSQELWAEDPELAAALDREVAYQDDTLQLVAHASLAAPSVLSAAGSALANATAEGYPGARYHPGAVQFDQVERLAVERAKAAFRARYANVQPHSCSSANLTVLFTLLAPGDTVLSLDLDSGGHLTHGAAASVTGRYFDVVHYGLDADGYIDEDQAARLALEHRPRLVVVGASAYPRTPDYARFRAISDSVGAYLLADISHVAGLVAAGVHPSPVDLAHITTSSTYKQLGGPRGGIILSGRDFDRPGPDGTPLYRLLQRGVFPLSQGTPNPSAIAAKARALALVAQPEFTATAKAIAANAAALAVALDKRGWPVLTGGTENHTVLLDTYRRGITGAVAETALESCGIHANKNRIRGDTKPPLVTSGLRLGTNITAQRGMREDDMDDCAGLVDRVLTTIRPTGDRTYDLTARDRDEIRSRVAEVCRRFPTVYHDRRA
ncbi:serine hydroxymethyltransferase [Streptomyces tsukubensis]|uniref:serine hydroxymethyltransferase n=1 Tax=Streptomyces tsukubensis TaxID=83656 RepID=UPI001D03D5E5|nr:serine hydroxymethyltransferase [Streptomyces tsukubensis]